MKSSSLIKWLQFFTLALMVSSCNMFTDESTDNTCGEHEILTPFDVSVQYEITINRNQEYPTLDHTADTALEIEFHGTIRQFACNEEEKAYNNLDYTIYPKESFGPNDFAHTFKVGLADSYTLSNTREYMQIDYTMKAVFSDGAIYESSEVTEYSATFGSLITQGTALTLKLESGASWTRTAK
jgi:hypothetical protein